MARRFQAILPERGVLAVGGPDRHAFLQGLISTDIERVSETRATYAALLTPQGKYLFDFFIAELDGNFLLDAERARLDDLKRRLGIYRLRAKVEIDDASHRFQVAALWGEDAIPALDLAGGLGAARRIDGGVVFADPRLAEAGARALMNPGSNALTDLDFATAEPADYDLVRLGLGLPDGSRDLGVDKAILLENGFEELHGVDFDKGCFLGQELTARTKHRGLVKKRLVPVAIDGPAPPAGAIVRLDEADVGDMRSTRNGIGLALLRLDAIDKAAAGARLACDGAVLVPRLPAWARLE